MLEDTHAYTHAHEQHNSNKDCMGGKKWKNLFYVHWHSISILSDFFFFKFTITSSSLSRSLPLYRHAIIVSFKVIINYIIASSAPAEAPPPSSSPIATKAIWVSKVWELRGSWGKEADN